MISLKLNKILILLYSITIISSCKSSNYFVNNKLETQIMKKLDESFISRDEKYMIVYFFNDSNLNYIAISSQFNLYDFVPDYFFKYKGKTVFCKFENSIIYNSYAKNKNVKNIKIFKVNNQSINIDGGLNKIFEIKDHLIHEIIPSSRILEKSFINLEKIKFERPKSQK